MWNEVCIFWTHYLLHHDDQLQANNSVKRGMHRIDTKHGGSPHMTVRALDTLIDESIGIIRTI